MTMALLVKRLEAHSLIQFLPKVMYPMLSPTTAPVPFNSSGGSR